MVRFGFRPEERMASAAPKVVATPVPSSVVPCARSQESRCPPTTMTCSGYWLPRISPTTLAESTGLLVTSFCTLIFMRTVCPWRSEEHTSELQSQFHLVCRLLLEKKKKHQKSVFFTTYTKTTINT